MRCWAEVMLEAEEPACMQVVLSTGVPSSLKVLVDGSDVCHNALPVRSLSANHVIDVQIRLDANTLCSLESQGEVSPLVQAGELLVRNVSR